MPCRSFVRLTLVVLVCGVLPGVLQAQGLPRGDARELGFVPEKLTSIGGLLNEAVAAKKLAGASAMVGRKGKVAYLALAGQQDAEAGTPFSEQTIVRIASMTKPITSVAAMMLVEEGKLSLDDPLSKHIPEFKLPRVLVTGVSGMQGSVRAQQEITIKHLLTHTSGITYGFWGKPHITTLYDMANIADGLIETPGTMADNVRRIAKAPLLNEPGAAWEYGLNTDVLGRVVEILSEKTLDEFFRERIFTPLKMDDTFFIVPQDKRDRLAAVYTPGEDKAFRRVKDGPITIGPVRYSATYSTSDTSKYFSGGAGLCSTINDYARFVQMLLNGGELDGVRLLKTDTVAQMTSNQLGDLKLSFTNHGDGFGLGFGVITDRPTRPADEFATPGSFSWGGFFYTYFWGDPKKDLFGIFLTQMYPFEGLKLHQEFEKRTYQALAP